MKKIIKPKIQKISINKNPNNNKNESKSENSLEQTTRSPIKTPQNLLVAKLLNHSKKNLHQLRQEKIIRKNGSRKHLGNYQLKNMLNEKTDNSRKSINNSKLQSFNRTEKSNKIVFTRRNLKKSKGTSISKQPKMLKRNDKFHQTQLEIRMSLNTNKLNPKNSLQNIRNSIQSNNQNKNFTSLQKFLQVKKSPEQTTERQKKLGNFFELDIMPQNSMIDVISPSENDNKLFYTLLKKKIIKFYHLFLLTEPTEFKMSQENILNELDILQCFIQQKLQFHDSFNSTNFPSDVLTDQKRKTKNQKIQSLINTKYENNTVQSYANTENKNYVLEDLRNKKIDQLEKQLDQQQLDSQKQISQLKFELNEKEQHIINLRKQVLKLKIEIQQNISNMSRNVSRPSTSKKSNNKFSVSNIMQKQKVQEITHKPDRELSVKIKKERQKYELKLKKLEQEKKDQEKKLKDQKSLDNKIRQQDNQIQNLTRQIEIFKNQLQLNLEQSYSNPNLPQFSKFNQSFKKLASVKLSKDNSNNSFKDYYDNPFKSEIISQNGNTEDIEEIELSENMISEAEIQSNKNKIQNYNQLYVRILMTKIYC